MPHNDPLPAELTDLKQRLCRLPLPAAKLSREATLYQCGWAAAEAHIRGQQSRRGWIWQASSGVLAASVVVLAVLLVRQDATHQADSPPSGDGSYARQSVVVDRASVHWPIAQARPLPFFDFGTRFAPNDRSLLAVRERALRGVFADPTYTADQGNASRRQPKTWRELLDELLEGRINS